MMPCLRRLIAPSTDYVSVFRPTLKRAQLAWRCAAAITDNPLTSYEAALAKVRLIPSASCHIQVQIALLSVKHVHVIGCGMCIGGLKKVVFPPKYAQHNGVCTSAGMLHDIECLVGHGCCNHWA